MLHDFGEYKTQYGMRNWNFLISMEFLRPLFNLFQTRPNFPFFARTNTSYHTIQQKNNRNKRKNTFVYDRKVISWNFSQLIGNRNCCLCCRILFIHTRLLIYGDFSLILFLSSACSLAALPLFTYLSYEEITWSFLSLLTRLNIQHLHLSS